MRKWICVFACALLLAACGKKEAPPATAPATQAPAAEAVTPTQEAAPTLTADELVGPWYLDTEKNDMPALQAQFGASLPDGCSMELRSNGQISYSLGGGTDGAGTYTLAGDALQARFVTFSDSREESCTIRAERDSGKLRLVMDIHDATLCWVQDTSLPEEPGAPEGYGEILELYSQALHEGWNPEKCIEENVNYLLGMGGTPESIGYWLKDVDSDGSPELLIGPMEQPNIYAMYTLADGKATPVIDAGERSAWYLEPDGILVNRGSSSAFESCMMFYWLKKGSLELNNGLISDYRANETEPWYLTTDTDSSRENDTKLSTEKAESLVKAYEQNYILPDYTPFSRYAAG